MAEKKSGGKLKKLLIFTIVLAVIGGVVLALVLAFSRGNTTTIDRLNSLSTTMVTDNEDTKASYKAMQDKIASTAGVSYYETEIKDFYDLSESLDDVVDFYNEYYVFAKDNKIREKQSKKITKSIRNIKSNQKELKEFLVKSKTIETQSHLQNLWIDYRAKYIEQFKNYQKLFVSLNKVYHGCLGETFAVSNASRNVFDCVDSYMVVIAQDLTALSQQDVKGNKESDYTYTLSAKIEAFGEFCSSYVEDDDSVQMYYYSPYYQTLHNRVAKFESLTGDDFEEVIKSVEEVGGVPVAKYAVPAEADSETQEICSLVKLFVVGGE